jgi:hypothetical protein
MPCDVWCKLLERYRSAVTTYDEAAHDLSGVPGGAFNETWQRAEQARKQSESCRADLLQHEHEHACIAGTGLPEVNQTPDVSSEELILSDQAQAGWASSLS